MLRLQAKFFLMSGFALLMGVEAATALTLAMVVNLDTKLKN